MLISDWSSDVCSSDLTLRITGQALNAQYLRALRNREHPGFGRSGQGSPNTLRAGHRKYPRTLKRCVERVTHGIQIREELRGNDSMFYRQRFAIRKAHTREPCDLGDRKSTRLNSSH